MLTRIGWMLVLLLPLRSAAQTGNGPVQKRGDSTRLIGWIEEAATEPPVIWLNENNRSDDAGLFMPSLLGANRDILLGAAAFHFNVFRFRVRGYDAAWSRTLINGIAMNNPENGFIPWSYWSGLNDVTRNVQVSAFLRADENDFGDIGISSSIDMRAFRQRAQTQLGYSFSNRSYTHRLSGSYARGMNAKGWAYAVSAGARYAEKGYMPGTFVSGAAYYLAVDRKIGADIFSVCVFGNAALNGKQSASVKEVRDITGSVKYNAYWGYQHGQPRNANAGYTHVPVLMINYDRRISNHESCLFSLAAMYGRRSATGLDWYHAPDPRPDYYRNLPSFSQDTALRAAMTDAYASDPGLLQVNWDRLYAVNRNSNETVYDVDGLPGSRFTGLRSHYILEERVTKVQRADAGMRYQSMLPGSMGLSAGVSAQWQRLRHFKQIRDLLGGEYYMDWNQFAEGDASVMQNDLDHPNRVLKKGDRYGYDYRMTHGNVYGWMQAIVPRKKWDLFFALKLGYATWFRDGLMRTGLFPEQSLGRSLVYEFAEYALKGGATHKFNGRHYLGLQWLVSEKAPSADDVLISPATRNTEQELIDRQQVYSGEISYHLQSPALKIRASMYTTWFRKGMNVLSFYHDGYRSFVNYALSGIDKRHSGAELGIEWKPFPRYAFTGAASWGSFLYTSRQNLVVTADNDAYVLERDVVYAKNHRVGGTPQQAYLAGVTYQGERGFYANLSISYFREHWLEMNPLRRTSAALAQLSPGSDARRSVLEQQRLPDQFTIDISGGGFFRLKQHSERSATVSVYAGINNLLNKQDMVSGGYEQLRFDANHINRFPAKFFYAMGLNFSVNISLRF
ncbi:TonB-dependent receptor [Sediminibacterium soli]|uniref:TonB-dependent receptor n=1 Tax=Sediminibacterium soli TaxID=2698829 RepID=UPI001379B96D|nr:TonB-dependent receptor [Sediminibacterium soli]NCI47165.1 TonB-dependent receptor [Sediminibacterium soli]